MRNLVTIFAASVTSNLKLFRKFQMESLKREFTLHRRSSNCDKMFADSSGKFQVNVRFQVKVRFNLSNGRQKGARAPPPNSRLDSWAWHC